MFVSRGYCLPDDGMTDGRLHFQMLQTSPTICHHFIAPSVAGSGASLNSDASTTAACHCVLAAREYLYVVGLNTMTGHRIPDGG
jgi:hypothetical protein